MRKTVLHAMKDAGLPEQAILVGLAFLALLVLSPFFGGQIIGGMPIPKVPYDTSLSILSTVLLIVLVLPIMPSPKASPVDLENRVLAKLYEFYQHDPETLMPVDMLLKIVVLDAESLETVLQSLRKKGQIRALKAGAHPEVLLKLTPDGVNRATSLPTVEKS